MLAVMAYYTDLSFDQSRNNHFPQPSNNPYRPLRSELSDPKFEDHAPPNIYAGFYPSTDGPSVEVPSFTSWRALVERGIKVVTNLGHSPTLATKSFARADDKLELLELVRQSVPVVLLVMIDDKEFVLKIFPRTTKGRVRYEAEKAAYINLTRYASCNTCPQCSSRFPWPQCCGLLRIPLVIADNPTSWATVGHAAIGGAAATHVPRGTVSVIPPESLMRWLPDYFCLTGVAPAKEAPSPSLNRCSNGFNNLSTAKEVPRRTCAPLFFRALILEYLTSPYVPLTPSTLTPALARASLNALTTIHAALVLHNDFQSEQDDCYQFRNIMVAAGEKGEAEAQAVWIDFDHAEAYISKEATPKFTQYRLREEGFLVWDTFWNYILPAQGGVYYEPGRSIDNMSDWMKRRWRLCGERAKMGEEDKEDGGMRGKQYPAGCDSGQNE